jgi:hypothetical protein
MVRTMEIRPEVAEAVAEVVTPNQKLFRKRLQ